MDTNIREDKILEFKALTTTNKVFHQMREVIVKPEVELIGWINLEGYEWFIGKLGNTLIKARRMEIFDVVVAKWGRVRLDEEAKKAGVGPSYYINIKVDELRDSLPQIFLK